MNVCQYCENTFLNKHTLSQHQKTAKYCLKLQGKANNVFKCVYCSKKFSTKQNMDVHSYKCQSKNKFSYERKLEEKDIQIEELKEQIENLQNKLENIAIKAVQRSTTTVNKTQINNFIQNMPAVTTEQLLEHSGNLTLQHVQKGASGYAEYALEYPLKDRIACVDYSRRKIKFKDTTGNVVTDPEMSKLAPMFFESIKEKSSQLVHALNTPDMDSAMFEEVAKLFNVNADVKHGSSGVKTEFYHDFVKHVCSGSMVE